jgi:hypothetical protein
MAPAKSSAAIREELYQPLSLPNTIRLLRIFPRRLDKPLSCTLHTVSLDDNPLFTAISYYWGEPAETNPIMCNGHKVDISSNLWWALQNACYFDQPELIWADQLCIDQTNLDERGSQVQLMGRIYRQARRVWASLGKGYGDSEEMSAMKLCSKISVRANIARENSGRLRYTGNQDLQMHGLPPFKSVDWQALQKLLLSPWFRRVWITQEFALASNVTLCCARIILDLDLLWNLEDNLRYLELYDGLLKSQEDDAKSLELAQSMQCIRILCETREAVLKRKSLSLDTFLSRDIVRGAKDSRDHIYAFLGLVSDSSISELLPNYHLEPREAFIRCCTYLFNEAKSLSFLYEAGAYQKTLNLPSWVPDWMVFRETLSLGRHDRSPYSQQKPIFHAAQGMAAVRHINTDQNVLVVRGSRIDSLDKLGNILPPAPEDSQQERAAAIELWLRESDGFASATTENRDEALMWTLLTDNTHVPERYKQLAVDDYRAFKQVAHLRGRGNSRLPEAWAEVVTRSNRFEDCALNRSRNRRLCLTEGKGIGQVPKYAQSGDEVWIFLGAKVPFVLRRVGPRYILVGECYIHGIMYGEAVGSTIWNLCDVELV